MIINGGRWLLHPVRGPGNILLWVMLYSLQTEIIDTNNVDFLALFIGDDDDTMKNLGDSG